jgi:hypothetical protein
LTDFVSRCAGFLVALVCLGKSLLMVSGVGWVARGALLLGGGFIVVACATGGPGDSSLGFGTDDAGFEAKGDGGGGASNTSGSSGGGDDATGLNSATGGDDESGVAASGGSGDDGAAAVCSPESCQSGCCSNGACSTGLDDTACGGSGGAACVDCTATNQVCSFGTCVAGNTAAAAPTDPGTGSNSGSSSPPAQMPPTVTTTCNGMTCTNACFPLGLPCCTSAGACGCIDLYFLPCN